MQQRTVTLSPADILSLLVTPFQIAGAPGPNFALVPVSITGKLLFGTTPYAGGSNLTIQIGPLGASGTQPAILAGVLTAGADEIQLAPTPAFTAFAGSSTLNENMGIFLSIPGPAFTLGDGSLIVTIFYGVAPTV